MHPGIDLRLQRCAVVLADTLSFSEAAKKLHVAQPALSKSIQQLEQYVGVVLFARNSRKVALTDAGRRFVEEARQALLHAERAVEAVAVQARELIFGYPPQFDTRFILDVGKITLPGNAVRVAGRSSFSAEIIAKILNGEFDFGIVVMPGRYPEAGDCKIIPLLRFPLTAALPETHPLAGRAVLQLAELKDQPLVVFARDRNPALYDWFQARCATAGFDPNIAREVKDPHEFSAMILHRLGIGVGIGLNKNCPITQLPQDTVIPSFCEPDLGIQAAMIFGQRFKGPRLKPFFDAIVRLRNKYRQQHWPKHA